MQRAPLLSRHAARRAPAGAAAADPAALAEPALAEAPPPTWPGGGAQVPSEDVSVSRPAGLGGRSGVAEPWAGDGGARGLAVGVTRVNYRWDRPPRTRLARVGQTPSDTACPGGTDPLGHGLPGWDRPPRTRLARVGQTPSDTACPGGLLPVPWSRSSGPVSACRSHGLVGGKRAPWHQVPCWGCLLVPTALASR
ncbi:unnamed protein product [Lepidochelys olivacea]